MRMGYGFSRKYMSYSGWLSNILRLGGGRFEKKKINIGLTHVFSCINICRSRGSCLNRWPFGRVFKHHQRDPGSD